MVDDRPVAAFTLSLVGFVFQILGATFVVYMSLYGWSFWGMMPGPWMMMGGSWAFGYSWSPLYVIFAAAEVSLGLLGILWMNNTDLARVRTGSVLVLLASIIAFPTMFGFMVGSLLMLIGSILGLTWQPRPTQTGGI